MNVSDMTLVKNSVDNKVVLTNLIEEMKKAEKCGICEESGDTSISWFNHVSGSAHSICYKEIEEIESNLIKEICSIFKNNTQINFAHEAAIEAVNKELDGASIKTLLDNNEHNRLKEVFDSVGIEAVKTYAQKFFQ